MRLCFFLHRVSAWTEKVGMTDDESTLIKMAITITVAILIYIISGNGSPNS